MKGGRRRKSKRRTARTLRKHARKRLLERFGILDCVQLIEDEIRGGRVEVVERCRNRMVCRMRFQGLELFPVYDLHFKALVTVLE
ncbi:MAG: hypothetical protein AB7D47_04400 [Desulfovibrio sp.]